MSLYQLQAAIYRYLNPKDGPTVTLDRGELLKRFDLTERELDAFVEPDIPELHRLGVHPVLMNSYARARIDPAEYRKILANVKEGPGQHG